jgi:tripartite-type tricarboxylate transporter receptor subunit TctC
MLAVSSLKRSSAAPNLPTIAESGLPGFEFEAWHVIVAPRGTPAALVGTLSQKIKATLSDRVVRERFDKGGMDVVPTTPKETLAYLSNEQAKWARVIRERNITAK